MNHKSSCLLALAIGLALSGSAGAQGLKAYDLRGGEKKGADGYVNIVPSGEVGNSQTGGQQGNLGGSGNNQPQTMTDVQYAQSDPASRINQLEEEVRMLNGKVEEMNFQILQMQESLRKQQEDFDFRLQELEGGNQDAGTAKPGKQGALEPAKRNEDVADMGDQSLGKSDPSGQGSEAASSDGTGAASGGNPQEVTIDTTKGPDGVELYDPKKADTNAAITGNGAAGTKGTAPAEKQLGTLVFDENGNVVDTTLGKPLDLTANQQASLNPDKLPDTPNELYDLGYGYIEAGNYPEADKTFSAFVNKYPDNERISEASYWRGESLFAQQDFKKAAEVFLNNHKKWPKSRFGPQNMLKLGLSLAGMNQRELACATFAEIGKTYPDMSQVVKQQVSLEQKSAKCIAN